VDKILTLNIVSNKGNIYTVSGLNTILSDPYCDCKGFRYDGKCKHIEQAIEQLKEMLDDNEDKEERNS